MSRAAVVDTLMTAPGLNTLGLDSDSIFQAELEKRPLDAIFAKIRWGVEGGYVFGTVKPPRRLMVYVHIPWEKTNDYTVIDDALEVVEDVLTGMEQVEGTDGYTVTCVRYTGRSEDLKDEGLQTFYRWAAFEVLSRKEE